MLIFRFLILLYLSMITPGQSDPLLDSMTFEIVRRSDLACEPTCPEWISAAGVIDRSTTAKFKRLRKALQNKRLPIVFNSFGGDILIALQLGREIRKYKFDTAIGNTETYPCEGKNAACNIKDLQFGLINNIPAYCDSACAYALAGGIRRSSIDTNYIRVHQGSPITYNNSGNKWIELEDKDRIERVDKKVLKAIRSGMAEFGIEDEFVEFVYSHSDLYFAPFDLLLRYKLINDVGVEEKFTPGSCKLADRPKYCVNRLY